MSDSLYKNPQVILCDMCIGEDRKPARKTCMKCEISMCMQHLQAHLTTPVLLQTHPLTAPVASGDGGVVGTTKCLQHSKVFEYYCLDDLISVCVSCAIEDQHRLHNMKTFSTAHKELLEKVTAEQQALQVKTNGEDVSLEKWEKKEREKLGRSSVRLIEAVTNLRDLALTSVQSSVSARMVSMKTSLTSLQTAKTEEDTVRFLQMYSQVHQDLEKANAVDLRKGLEPGDDRDKLVKEIKERGEKMIEQASRFWGSLLTHVDPENHQELGSFSSDLIFEPQSLGQGVTLSVDRKKVFYSGHLGKSVLLLQNMRPITDLTVHRWGISLSKDFDWTIGLCDKRYAQDSNYGQVYGLCCEGNQLSSLVTDCEVASATTFERDYNAALKSFHFGLQTPGAKRQKVSLQVVHSPGGAIEKHLTRPEKVEVEWSHPNLLSFYNLTGPHQRKKIVTIKTKSTNQVLATFVSLEMGKLQKNLARVSGGLNFGIAVQQQPQEGWKCLCGKVHHGRYEGSINRPSHRKTCACGQIIGVPQITEILCELL
ncbi:tripartite motif-containing protein 16 isoform X1 [Xyrichtys novacula]|uniref:Tripartite motif-containing protein 16 isoform X1 n=1 Tax=Xyrichtys novacula TaxID=13765 RepID=A0AAV1HKH4_XYRNO|nr:tripartite motif-containing protein 16 isoform X1 [Xyrichtys novacula]